MLIIGDYTARVGDPSGRSATRPVLSGEEIDANARTYVDQAGKVLRTDERLEIRHNSEWLDMTMEALFGLVRHATVAQLLERDDFAKRFAAHEPISLLELLYPVLQGYDSVAVDADVELGGTDQTFNLLMGRAIQSAYGQPPQVVLTMPLLVGHRRRARRCRSRSATTSGVTDPPDEMYGKTLSIPDAAMPSWYDLLLGHAAAGGRVAARRQARPRARARDPLPRAEAAAARRGALRPRAHRARGARTTCPGRAPAPGRRRSSTCPSCSPTRFGMSRSEARRTIGQGGVRLDGEPVRRARLAGRRSSTAGCSRSASAASCGSSPRLMAVHTALLRLQTEGEGQIIDLSAGIESALRATEVSDGVVTVFVTGSTAAITTMEYEPGGVQDLQEAVERLVPRARPGGGDYAHNTRNHDDNAHAHLRASLLGPSLLDSRWCEGASCSGTWQQIVLIDFDDRPRERSVHVQIAA